MEKYENGLSSDTITEWIMSDKGLYDIIQEIEKEDLSNNERAEIIFHRVSEYFNVPKDFDDVDSDSEFENCVYEELAYLKYLEPNNEEIKGVVMTAIYFVKFGYQTDINEIYKKYYSGNNEAFNGIGFKGDNSFVELVFVKAGESWFDLGCKYYVKRVKKLQ